MLFTPFHSTCAPSPYSIGRFLLIAAIFLLAWAPLNGQEALVTGHITDDEGTELSFATIRVLGSVIGASSDVEGHYEIEVPPGQIRLIYTYVGYHDVDTTITVRNADREITVDIVMTSAQNADLPDIIVFGSRAVGQAQALKLQQTALTTQTIIHSELFNKYPDITIAETVSRLPGVSMIRRIGEGEIVQVRGMPEQFTAVSLNGQRLPTVQPEVDQSGMLDLVQSNLVEEVRVVKSRTADMDGDAIGGTVDFRMRQPEQRLELLAQGGYGQNFGFVDNPGQESGITQLAAVVNSEASEEKIYGLVAGSYFKEGRGYQERVYDEISSPGQSSVNFSARPHDVDQVTTRTGVVGSVELRPSIYNRLRLGYNLSRVKNDVTQRQLFASNINPNEASGLRTAAWEKVRELKLVSLEAENNFPHTRVDYQLSFSQTRENLNDRLSNIYVGPTPSANFDFSTSDPSAYPAGAYSPILRSQENMEFEEDIAILSLNVTQYLNKLKTSFLRIGGRYRSRDRTYGTFLYNEAGQGPTVTDGEFPEPLEDRLVGELPDLTVEGLDYDASQRIRALYAMYAANLSSRLSVTAGLRYETRKVTTREQRSVNEFSLEEDNLLPSVNLTLRTSNRTKVRQLRLSAYQAVARANYASYLSEVRVPLMAVDQFSIGNQNLNSTKSNNIDLTYERYGRRDGQITVGLYYKELQDPTLRVTTTNYDRSYRPVYVTQLVNASTTNLFGFELGMFQNLGFLGATDNWRFWNLNATYNFNFYNADGSRFNVDDFTLPQSPRQTANLSIAHNNTVKGVSVVIAGNYRGRVFDRLMDNRLVYRNGLFTLDLAADVRVYQGITLYARANNLTNHPLREYYGNPDDDGAILRTESRYGVWAVMGVRYRPL